MEPDCTLMEASTARFRQYESHSARVGPGNGALSRHLSRQGFFVWGRGVLAGTVRIGVMFSTTGSYSAVGAAMAAGAHLAISEINKKHRSSIKLEPVFKDPAGRSSNYFEMAQDLLTVEGLSHVVGCYTSSSRKEVLPIFEKFDALLWYPSHYEGFESSENVIYTGAAPNQHVIPLARYLLRHFGARGWFVGSNYVWAWENNRILRETLTASGGEVLGERYFPVGEMDLGGLVRQIIQDGPDFIFTTLIGESGYEFICLLRHQADALGIDQATAMPVASCSLSEVELPHLGRAASGHLSSSVYFSTIQTDENARFSSLWNRSYGHLGQPCADAEATYVAVHLLAKAIEHAGETGFAAVRDAVRNLTFNAPQGPVTVDAGNLHCSMRPRIGRSTQDGTFELQSEARVPVAPDPYLVWTGFDEVKSGPSTPCLLYTSDAADDAMKV